MDHSSASRILDTQLIMYDWQDFNTVFKGRTDYSFDQKQVETIQRNRNECGGTLFFDRVWLNVGLRQRECLPQGSIYRFP